MGCKILGGERAVITALGIGEGGILRSLMFLYYSF